MPIRTYGPGDQAPRILPGPGTPVLALSGDGQLAGGYADGTVRIAAAEDWPAGGLASAQPLSIHDSAVTALAYADDGRL
jgi:hypothetical protein